MMCGTAENQVPEWRATVAVRKNSMKRQLLDVSVQLFWRFFETARWGGQKIVAISMRF